MKHRIIGIDFGLARIGIAISDENKLIAFPYKTIETEKKSEKTIDKLLESLKNHQKEFGYEIESIVVGKPLMMSGREGWFSDEAAHFVDKLKEISGFDVVLWDERLTTVIAERSLREGSLSHKKRKKLVDKVSAVLILQSYLDYKKRPFGHEPGI